MAKADLREIGVYTAANWSAAQAVRYLAGIESSCRRLVASPEMGRRCDHIRLGLRRIEHAQHVVLYRVTETQVVVRRILHRNMLSELHEIDE